MSSESAVSGFQFVLSDYPNAINITGAGGGISGSYGFTTSSNESGTILSFSLTGAQIPAGNHTLVEIDFEVLSPGSTTTLCLEEVILSDPTGSALVVNVEDCESVELLSITSGDINFDTSLDVLDVVLLVNEILQAGGFTSSQFIAADMNGDGVLNVVDVVLLVNEVLG